ncbi:hypothetical protein T06_13081, partial [Trichinella sp. T6]
LCYSRFVASVKRDHECLISAYTCRFYSYTSPMPYNPTQLSESCKSGKHCDYSSFMHYVFTKILRYSYAVLDCASIKANVLHVQKCSDRLPSLSISGASADLVAFAMALLVMDEVTVCGQLTKADLINGITLLKAGNDAKAQYWSKQIIAYERYRHHSNYAVGSVKGTPPVRRYHL